jgi:hypothetical protein
MRSNLYPDRNNPDRGTAADNVPGDHSSWWSPP